MVQTETTRQLPKGLPAPSEKPATWRVYVAIKQWRKVEQVHIGNPEDKLIVEGAPTSDSDGKLIVLATSIKSTTLENQARQQGQGDG